MKFVEQTINLLQNIGDYSSIYSLLSSMSKNCSDIIELDFIAKLQSETKDYKGAIDTLQKMLLLSVNNEISYSIRANLAKTFNHMNEPHQSILYTQANLAINPNDLDSIMELQFSKYLAGEKEESKKILNKLLSSNIPEEIRNRCRYNKGSWDLDDGDFKEGLYNHVVVGHEQGLIPIERIPMIPVWDGTIDSSKTVVILSEGGIGDQFISIRFCAHLKRLGMDSIFVASDEKIKTVFARNGYNCILRDEIDNINCLAVQAQAFFLPLLLQLDYDQLWTGPYIKPSDEYLEKWSSILPKDDKLCVKWFGNYLYEQDLHRSLPLHMIEQIKFNGVKISLQLEKYESDSIIDYSEQINEIEDTLAIIQLSNDMITSCTSVAHMAGSMGQKCIVCPPISTYFTWLGSGEQSNWYDKTMRVVRQSKWKDWTNVFVRVQELLSN